MSRILNGHFDLMNSKLHLKHENAIPITTRKNIIAIHQPDFMPWLGFFYKLSKSDCFVLLDHVHMDVKNSGWIKRVKFLINGTPQWVSIPLKRPLEGFSLPINRIMIDLNNPHFQKAYRCLNAAFLNYPYYKEYKYLLDAYFMGSTSCLCDKNFEFIQEVIKLLNLNIKIYKSSDIKIKLTKSEMNAEIVELLGGTVYMSGQGAASYQNEDDFKNRNIELRVSDFDAIKFAYSQLDREEFKPGLSVVDTLMNIGAEETTRLITQH
jgi:hypothetical protein